MKNGIKYQKILSKNNSENFIKRCKKIIKLKGGRLKPAHLRQIRQETNEEQNNDEEQMISEDKNTEKNIIK